MESSQFTDSQSPFESLEPLEAQGATCDTFRVKLYGKLHFLKRLKPKLAADIRHQEAFRKEFETGYRLEHPHLVRYITLNDDGILMEYVDGETLTQRLERQPEYFNERKHTDKFIRQLLDAVSYLHSHQVLHLDLKPDNIMLTRIGDDVKLIDLGCCLTDTFADTPGRTPAFAAPEQLAGEAVDVRTDIYAIGRILQLLPCHHIYNKVIARCTAPDKADRYQSVEEALREINHRKPYLRYVAFTVILVSAIAAGMFLFHQPTAQPVSVPVIQEPEKVIAPETTLPPSEEGTTDPTPIKTMEAPSATASKADVPVEKEGDRETSGALTLTEVVPAPVSAYVEIVPPPVSVPMEVVPAPSQPSHKSDDATQMKEDMEKMIDKAYRSTIVTFCDSVFPSLTVGRQWERQSSEFHAQVLQIAADISRKYPDVPESTVIHHAESHFLSLVGYVFNRMRENGERLSEMEFK